MTSKKRTISLSVSQQQIDQIDRMARDQRVQTGENVTRSQVARRLIDTALGQQPQAAAPPPPAGETTPVGGRGGERSAAATGGVQHGQEG